MSTNTAKRKAAGVHNASHERRAREKEALRESILRAAGDVFLERGYDGLSMRQVAERIGYTATTIYLYFKNKEDLLFALLNEGYAELGQRLAAAAAAERDPLQRLAAIGRAYIAFGLERPSLYQVMFMRRADFLAARFKESQDDHCNPFNVLARAVADALQAGVLKPGDVMSYAMAMWAVVHGLVSLALIAPDTEAGLIERMTQLTVSATLSGFQAQAMRRRASDRAEEDENNDICEHLSFHAPGQRVHERAVALAPARPRERQHVVGRRDRPQDRQAIRDAGELSARRR